MLSTPPSRPTAAGAPLPRWVGGPAARAPTARAGWRATSGSRPTTSGMSSTTASPRRGIPRARPRDFSTPSRAAPGATRPRCSAQPPAFASTASSAGKSSAFAARRTPPPLPHPSPSPSPLPEGEGINAPPPHRHRHRHRERCAGGGPEFSSKSTLCGHYPSIPIK